jgi:hypothetical protein
LVRIMKRVIGGLLRSRVRTQQERSRLQRFDIPWK